MTHSLLDNATGAARVRAARDFLLAHREDYDTAYRDFRWPVVEHFNWALDWFDRLADEGGERLALWIVEEDGSVPTVFFHHSEPDMQLVLKQAWTSIGSDGTAVNPDGPTGQSHPHPRYYGTFPRVLGRYVRELKVLTLPEAVKKMTSMNADKIGIKDRGRLREGLWADVTIFDPGDFKDRATYADPHQYPTGNRTTVIVNGNIVVEDAAHTGALPGKVLRRDPAGHVG